MSLLDCACGRKILAKPEWAGKRLRCSACGAVLAVPEDDTGDEPADTACQHCGKPVRKGAYRCMHCRESLKKAAKQPGPVPAITEPIPVDPLPPDGGTKACPFCAETIQAEAVKCHFCKEDLSGGRRRAASSAGARRVDTGGTGALVMAIIGWVICGLLHPVAWYMGASYVSECEAAGVEPSGAGRAAKILGLVGTIIIGGVVVLGLLFAVLGVVLH